jgi:hypothetical protein
MSRDGRWGMLELTDYVLAIIEFAQGWNMRFDCKHHLLPMRAIGNIQHFLYHVIGKWVFHHLQ